MGQFDVGFGVAGGLLGGTTTVGAVSSVGKTSYPMLNQGAEQMADWLRPTPSATYPDGSPWRLTGDVARWIGSLALVTLPLPTHGVGWSQGLLHAAATPSTSEQRHLRPRPTAAIDVFRMKDDDPEIGREPAARLSGTQSVARALEILDAVAERPMMLAELAAHVGLSRTTCYRLANALVEQRLLATSGRSGYSLGVRIDELADALAKQRTTSDRAR